MSTAITEKITQGQTTQMNRFIEDTITKLDLSKDEAQEIIKKFDIIKPEFEKLLRKHSVADNRFGPALIEFELTVPKDYKHNSRLDAFAKQNKKKFYGYNSDITDKNFAKATNKLEPGKTFKVKIFPILATVSSKDCMAFLKTQRAILVGAQGVSLAWESNKEQFPVGKGTASFDEKDALWQGSFGDHRVPRVFRFSDGDFHFGLGGFGDGWDGGNVLLCFCDK
jgi:hypothetical protein